MNERQVEPGFWCGCAWATQEDHDDIARIYRHHSFADLPFMVANDLRSVRVTNHPRAADGLWTLANMRARYDLTPRQVAAMATRMRRAVEVWDEGCERLG